MSRLPPKGLVRSLRAGAAIGLVTLTTGCLVVPVPVTVPTTTVASSDVRSASTRWRSGSIPE